MNTEINTTWYYLRLPPTLFGLALGLGGGASSTQTKQSSSR
jgi:hypothetical protein